MTEVSGPVNVWRYVRSGAVAGAISVFTFTLIHYLVISNIWSMLIIMMIAGVLCGSCLAWSYAVVVERPSAGSWIGYNGLYVVMFVLLGIASVLVFEPVTTIPALLLVDEPPNELFMTAMPMTVVFTLGVAFVLSLVFSRSWRGYGAILLTSVVLVLFLGLNVSVLGLVNIPRGALYLVAELFTLIFALGAVYVAAFMALEWKSLVRSDLSADQSRSHREI